MRVSIFIFRGTNPLMKIQISIQPIESESLKQRLRDAEDEDEEDSPLQTLL